MMSGKENPLPDQIDQARWDGVKLAYRRWHRSGRPEDLARLLIAYSLFYAVYVTPTPPGHQPATDGGGNAH